MAFRYDTGYIHTIVMILGIYTYSHNDIQGVHSYLVLLLSPILDEGITCSLYMFIHSCCRISVSLVEVSS